MYVVLCYNPNHPIKVSGDAWAYYEVNDIPSCVKEDGSEWPIASNTLTTSEHNYVEIEKETLEDGQKYFVCLQLPLKRWLRFYVIYLPLSSYSLNSNEYNEY